MGLPVNSYTLFEAIAQNDGELLKKRIPVDIKLLAILLHDPESDPDFDLEVGRSFYNWHLNSGNELLFTALADPPESWMAWARENKGQFFGSNRAINELFNPKNIYQTFNPSLTALFISEYLKIPFGNLPVILFTPDLNLPYFHWMPTNATAVSSQLDWLKTIPKTYELPWIRGINHSLKVRKVRLNTPFSSILVDLSRKISELGLKNYYQHVDSPENLLSRPLNKKRSDSEIEINLFYQGIEFLKRKKDEFIDFESGYSRADKPRYMIIKDLEPKLYQRKESDLKKSFFQKLFNYPSKKNLVKPKSFEELIHENQIFLQRESKLFFKQGIEMVNSLENTSLFDYSPLILPFAKSFEKELSYSIVHWVRSNYDIKLPLYFYEYEPGKNAQVIMGRNFSIDFNQSLNDSWVSPTLGGQISGFKKAVSNFGSHPFKSDEDYRDFLNLAYQIKNIRNRACHSDRTTKSDLDKILSCWKSLFEKRFFETLSQIKKEYMGQSS
ncbi:hypothetical protein [Algoriphagus taiwanensis]|uniref:Apea-like HEPN domain-containing protein n=1 Tax=Algoriphagus taiwanensis TaxID=1445656 RepID=A0ABQ6PWB8_9BACT|nr:hypothetical protein Ataiwa_02080 [Algoriphagus taiwanensis]